MPRSVLVTGASRGIGRAIAQLYQSAGWTVFTPSRAELDLADPDLVERWIQAAPESIDVLINNAGENPIGAIESLERSTWERTLTVNLTAPVLLSRGLSGPMRRRKWGRIVNISSIFGLVSRVGRAPYTAAKTALVGFTRTAALEWGPDNILVNALCPGYIETDLTRQNNTPEQIEAMCAQLPLRRLGRPEEIARAAFFLGSDENTFITGQTLVADGGFSAQ